MITFMRSDDRLIHGQVQTQIIPLNGIKRVIAIDEPTASNAMLKRIFEMAAPQGTTAKVYTFDESIEHIKKAITSDKKTLIIARVPSTFAKLYRTVDGLPKELNVASIPHTEDKKKITDFCSMTDEEIAACNEMSANGVHIYLQLFPAKAAIDWDSVKI